MKVSKGRILFQTINYVIMILLAVIWQCLFQVQQLFRPEKYPFCRLILLPALMHM